MNMRHHFLGRVRTRYSEHAGMHFLNKRRPRAAARFRAQAAGDDHLAVFCQRFANGIE